MGSPKPSGGVSLGTLVFLAAVAVGLFLAIRIVPVYMDDVTVGRAAAEVLLSARTSSDEQLREELRRKLYFIGTHTEYDSWGNWKAVPGPYLPDEKIVIDRDSTRNRILLDFSYDRAVDLRPWPTQLRFHFRCAKEAPL